MTQSTRSGRDALALRSAVRDGARAEGVSLVEYLRRLLDDGEAGGLDASGFDFPELGDASNSDLGRLAAEIDLLAKRVETGQARNARAISGMDKSILDVVGRVDTAGRANREAFDRIARLVTDIEAAQSGLRSRIEHVEETAARQTADQLRALEEALGRLAETVQARGDGLEAEQALTRQLFEQNLTGVSETVAGLSRSVDAAADDALKRMEAMLGESEARAQEAADRKLQATSDALARTVDGRIAGVEGKVSAAEKRIEGAIGRIAEAASRFDQFEDKAERALEAGLSRSRALSEEVLARVDAIEERTRDVVGSLNGALAGITERLGRMEDSPPPNAGLERQLQALDERVSDMPTRAERARETTELRSLIQQGLDTLAADLAKPLQSMRADVERKLEEVLNSNQPEKLEGLDAAMALAQMRLDKTEAQQARLVDIIDEQIDRMKAAVDERLRAAEIRMDERSMDEVRAEMARLAEGIDGRLRAAERAGQDQSEAVSALRDEISRVESRAREAENRSASALERTAFDQTAALSAVRDEVAKVEHKTRDLEARSADALDNVADQVTRTAETLRRRQDERLAAIEQRQEEALAAISKRHDNTIADLGRRFDGLAGAVAGDDFVAFAEKFDERVRESEQRSADAIGQIGDQVGRMAERLHQQHLGSLRSVEARLMEAQRAQESELDDVLSEATGRFGEIGEQAGRQLAPVHATLASIAKRIDTLEDVLAGKPSTSFPPTTPAASLSPALEKDREPELIVLDDLGPGPAPGAPPAAPPKPAVADDMFDLMIDDDEVVGVDPPPFDRTADAHLFVEGLPIPPRGEAKSAGPEPEAPPHPVEDIEDLLDSDDIVFAPAAPPAFIAELPPTDPKERPDAEFLAEARRAAMNGRRVEVAGGGVIRRSSGRAPIVASAAIALAVAGGGAWTMMRGKQEPHGDAHRRPDPTASIKAGHQASTADDHLTERALFGDKDAQPHPEHALFDEGHARDHAAAKPLTIDDALEAGDPLALYDTASEQLQGSGDKARAAGLMKEAASKGLAMAQYRLAKLYEKGEGVPRDIAAARGWAEKAAINGNVKAMHDLAVFYAEGDSGPQSYSAAVEWFRQASELGLVDSQFNLAVLYEQGLGVSQDNAEAAYWFEIAGRAGDADGARRARALYDKMKPDAAELIRRKARAFQAKRPEPKANGEFGERPWNATTSTQIAEIQRVLERLGYKPGKADGHLGRQTVEAIRSFEEANGYVATGEADQQLLRQLRAAAGRAGG